MEDANVSVLRRLVCLMTRMYYDIPSIVVMDVLVQVTSSLLLLPGVILGSSLREEDLAQRVKLQVKQLQKICGKLKMDGLLSRYSSN